MNSKRKANHPRRYVIVGSGVAGVSAAEAIRSLDTQGEILMISDDPHGYYSRPGLAYYLTGEVDESSLFPYKEADFRRLGIHLIKARVERIYPAAHQFQLTGGRNVRYDRLLLAVGAQAALPNVPGIHLKGVVKLDHLEDTRHILRLARRSRRAVVVGGGITALELVEGLAARKLEVHYFLRGDRYWSKVLDENESKLIEQRLVEEGVHLHYRTEVAEVIGKKDRVSGVRTKDGQIIQADILAVAIGVRPRLDLARRSGLKTGKGIHVSEDLQTSVPDIYAAGDAAELIDAAGESVVNTLWLPARAQGWAAGLNMAGRSARYRRTPALNVARLTGLTTTIIGSVGGNGDDDEIDTAHGDSDDWQGLPDSVVAQRDFDVNRLRILVGEKTLVGAVVMGDQTLSEPIQHLVTQKVDVTPIREQLLNCEEPLGDLIATFWTQWRQNGSS